MSLVFKWAPAWCSPIEEANVLLGKSASLVLARKSASGLYSVQYSIVTAGRSAQSGWSERPAAGPLGRHLRQYADQEDDCALRLRSTGALTQRGLRGTQRCWVNTYLKELTFSVLFNMEL